MAKYKVGDRVRIVSSTDAKGHHHGGSAEHIGKETVITELTDESSLPYKLAVDNDVWPERDIELINEGEISMADTRQAIKELDLTPEDRLLRKHGLEDVNGVRTNDGLAVLQDMLWKEKRPEIVKKLQDIEAAEKAANKKDK